LQTQVNGDLEFEIVHFSQKKYYKMTKTYTKDGIPNIFKPITSLTHEELT
jgi:hypothetical protein